MLPQRRKILVVLIGILVVSSADARAQTPNTSILGTILDQQSGQPISRAVVLVEGIASTETDPLGNFAIIVPVAEPYRRVTISVTASSYGLWTMRDTPLYPGISRRLRIVLSEKAQVIQDTLPRALTQELSMSADQIPISLAPQYFSNSVLPSTIRVAITNGAPGYTNFPSCSGWVNTGKPVVRVDVLNLQEYASNVLPHEWYASWGDTAPDSLRAGAMAVKMFAWWRINLGGARANGTADVVDNTCDQVYVPNTQDDRTDAAVDQTWRFIMRRDGIVIEIHYLATVKACQDSILQPCMPQLGTYDDAIAGMTWIPIVHKYYDPVQIVGFWGYIPVIKR